MADVKDWSTTAGNNNQAPPDGFPEGMMPDGVNDGTREMMRATRKFANDLPWFEYGDGDQGYTATYVAADKFRIDGSDQTGMYWAGRRVKVVASTPGTLYGGITASTFQGGHTEVEVVWDSGQLSNEAITSVALSMAQSQHVGALEWVVKAQTITNAADYILSGDILALYDPIQIHISGLRPATVDDSLAIQVSQTTGAPWVSSGYKYQGPTTFSDSASVNVIRSNSASNIVFAEAVGSGVSDRVSGMIQIQRHWDTARTHFTSTMEWRSNNADGRGAQVSGFTEGAVHQAIRLYCLSGNITDAEISVLGSRRT